jgi:Tol biopolymer transport system component
MKRDIYRNTERLAIPGGDRYNEDNPHFAVTAYGRELFFDSDRPGSDGKNRIWVTREAGGKFSEPVLLASPVNVAGSTEAQPHLAADGRLFFTTTRDGVIAIDAARRTGENSWGAAARVLWPTKGSRPRVWAVGEPTLTADGQWLYFVAIFENDRGDFDADVARVRRAASAAR